MGMDRKDRRRIFLAVLQGRERQAPMSPGSAWGSPCAGKSSPITGGGSRQTASRSEAAFSASSFRQRARGPTEPALRRRAHRPRETRGAGQRQPSGQTGQLVSSGPAPAAQEARDHGRRLSPGPGRVTRGRDGVAVRGQGRRRWSAVTCHRFGVRSGATSGFAVGDWGLESSRERSRIP